MIRLFRLQTLILLIGTIFAWVTVYTDFARFYNFYGTLTRIRNCVIPNPLTTPCFYGAFVFIAGFIWSLLILRGKPEERIAQEKKLRLLLVAGTVFAWGNFAYETLRFYLTKNGPKVSCSGIPTDNILLTSCFYGSVIFLATLAVSLIAIRRGKTYRA